MITVLSDYVHSIVLNIVETKSGTLVSITLFLYKTVNFSKTIRLLALVFYER